MSSNCITADIETGNKRLLDVATALYESQFPHVFTMHSYAMKDGSPCDALANYAFRNDLQDLLGIEEDMIIYVSGPRAGEFAYWDDAEMLAWFYTTYREACDIFSIRGANALSETPQQAGDFIKKLVSQRMGDHGV